MLGAFFTNGEELPLMSGQPVAMQLGTPAVPFCPFYLGVSLLKLNSRKKGTLFIKGLLGNPGNGQLVSLYVGTSNLLAEL